MNKANVLIDGQNLLGEGPLWLEKHRQLAWVDILKNEVFLYDFSQPKLRRFRYDKPVTLLVTTDAADKLIVAMQGGIAELSLHDGALTPLLPLESDKPNNRTNDGGCDPYGRLWVGTMDKQFKEGAGNLYMLNDGQFVSRVRKTTIANGLVWSPDGQTMYFIDSPRKAVSAYAYASDGGITPLGDVVRIPEMLGGPDGMAIDEEGMLWIAHYGGYSVGRWNPHNGELLEKIAVPAPNVTACTFGGSEMKTLFITTARQEMSADQLMEYPLSGSLFYTDTNVAGVKKSKALIG
ncbi:SMP-30/gluconolactonase/LRE family protein [Parapedobacter indicus]|uniref:Sugar lactone lactonase YvrE n=1 Tax=Parapedobacter indicus TaxID=1477437 RepID=A0A1I3RR39_9SPHI|nr:SMP-30/gluconolactonase/LRE family protein [Parapedobacter indicus]PPL00039.1 sugar lactone lactonase YvrE [Parapedobacter indicus]SFJ48179.1 Sugar lactone lactonase YvrE [Parapedobacter indicus]